MINISFGEAFFGRMLCRGQLPKKAKRPRERPVEAAENNVNSVNSVMLKLSFIPAAELGARQADCVWQGVERCRKVLGTA